MPNPAQIIPYAAAAVSRHVVRQGLLKREMNPAAKRPGSTAGESQPILRPWMQLVTVTCGAIGPLALGEVVRSAVSRARGAARARCFSRDLLIAGQHDIRSGANTAPAHSPERVRRPVPTDPPTWPSRSMPAARWKRGSYQGGQRGPGGQPLAWLAHWGCQLQ